MATEVATKDCQMRWDGCRAYGMSGWRRGRAKVGARATRNAARWQRMRWMRQVGGREGRHGCSLCFEQKGRDGGAGWENADAVSVAHLRCEDARRVIMEHIFACVKLTEARAGQRVNARLEDVRPRSPPRGLGREGSMKRL